MLGKGREGDMESEQAVFKASIDQKVDEPVPAATREPSEAFNLNEEAPWALWAMENNYVGLTDVLALATDNKTSCDLK